MAQRLYILWALPQGKTDRLDERPLTSFAISLANVEKVKKAAAVDGWHGFRTYEDTPTIPDFTKILNNNEGK